MSKHQPYGNVKMRGRKTKPLSCSCCVAINKKKYSEKYDAYFNVKANKWLEEKCSDTECEYCKDRPDRPL